MTHWDRINFLVDNDWKEKYDIVMKDIKHAAVFRGYLKDDEDITGPFRWPGFVTPVVRFPQWPLPNTNDWSSLVRRASTSTTDW